MTLSSRRRQATISAVALTMAAAASLGCASISNLLFPFVGTAPQPPASPGTPSSSTRALPAERTPTSTPSPVATLAATPGSLERVEGLQANALLAEHSADLSAMDGVTRYLLDIQISFDPDRQTATIDGMARILVTNNETSDWTDLPLMLWPNDPQYRSSMEAGPALVEGQIVVPKTELGGLALRLDLPNPLRPGQTLDLSLPFQIRASGPIGGFTPHRFGITDGVLLAPTFYPLVPRRLDGDWDVVRAADNGDTTNSDVGLYFVRVAAPAGYDLVASGVETSRREEAGLQIIEYVSGPMRDFALALGDLVMESRQAGDVQVRAWLLPHHAHEMDVVLDAAAFQVSLLSEQIGPYPYPELDVVDAPGAFGGIEYPGLVFIGTVGGADVILPTVHEVAHQWFYGLIGSDQLREPWLDEAGATYGEVLYFEGRYGSGRATGLLSEFRAWLRTHPEAETPVGRPVAEYESISDYALFVYLKGALFFDALRRELGDDVFFTFLREYHQRYAYGFTNSTGFQDAAEDSCGCDLEPLFDLWVHNGGPLPGP